MAWVNVVLLALTIVITIAQPEDGPRLTVMFTGLVTVVLLGWVIVPAADLAIRGPIVLRRRRQRRLRAAQLCLRCGYCLTGYLSGVCPECGTATAESG